MSGQAATAKPLCAPGAMPEGVVVKALQTHTDQRGCLTELYRRSWNPDEPALLQWNHVTSCDNVLRGVHVHFHHDDYLFIASGRMLLGLQDIREHSPSHGDATLLELRGDQPTTVYVPTGVAHGFYFPEPTVLFYGVTEYWNPEDELGCRWDDPGLAIPWPCRQPELSERDEQAGDLASMSRQFHQRWHGLHGG